MSSIKVTITPEDFRDANHGYYGSEQCPLYQALKRKGYRSEVGSTFLFIWDEGGQKYKIPYRWGEVGPNLKPWKKSYSIEDINRISEEAKVSLIGIPIVKLKLKRINENC